ncbi:hypothetical protein [Vulcanisaeta distributa]|uniref:hypothetical protein n=1 Tax=Vulcanisaeta distributa TaxID=164451 RepID=UPI000AFB07AF|nr:hypothetical protein [Vulcanisaeta distributa]
MDYSNNLIEVLGAYLLPLRDIEDALGRNNAGAKILVETPPLDLRMLGWRLYGT